MRISDWSSDVCSSDLTAQHRERALLQALPVGRHRIEEQLRNSEARYRAVFDNAQVSFWELDFSGVLDYLTRLRSQGVTDLRPYLLAHRDCVRKAAARLRVTCVNPYTLALVEADHEHALRSCLEAALLPETVIGSGSCGERVCRYGSHTVGTR